MLELLKLLKLQRRATARRNCHAVVVTMTAVSIACTAAVAAPTAEQRDKVETVAPLLASAAAFGEAYGVLVGPAADAIANQFASRAPIMIDI